MSLIHRTLIRRLIARRYPALKTRTPTPLPRFEEPPWTPKLVPPEELPPQLRPRYDTEPSELS